MLIRGRTFEQQTPGTFRVSHKKVQENKESTDHLEDNVEAVVEDALNMEEATESWDIER